MLPTKGMKNALGRRAQGSGKGFGITPTNNPKSGLPNKPPEHSSGGKGAPSVIGNGLAPAPSQMEGRAAIGSMPSSGGWGANKSPNAKGTPTSISGDLVLGAGQSQNGRPAPAAMARRIGKPAFGGAKGLPGGLNLGRGQEEHGRATAKKGNVLGKVGGSGFGGTARQPGDPADRKPGGIGGSKIGPGSFAPHPGISKLSPNNTGKPGSMLKGPKFPKGVPFGKNVK